MWKPTLGYGPRILLIFDLKCNEDRDAPLFARSLSIVLARSEHEVVLLVSDKYHQLVR
jgi:hypothetical protein